MREFMPRFVNLEKRDYWIVRGAAEEKGLGLKGFSAALRLIIREWEAAHKAAACDNAAPTPATQGPAA